jgi:hypothetical protein
MRSLRAWVTRLVGVFSASAGERDFDAELDSHLQLHVDDNIRAGMSPAAARRAALMALGGVAQAKEQHRDRRGLPALSRSAATSALACARCCTRPASPSRPS